MKRFRSGLGRLLASAAIAGLLAAPLPAAAIGLGPIGFSTSLNLQGDVTNTNTFGSSRESINTTYGLNFTGGTGAGQIDTIYHVQQTIAGSGTSTIDLAGANTDAFGNTVTFGHVKAIIVQASSGNTNDCQLGPGATNPFNGPWSGTTPLTAVSPGEFAVFTKGSASAVGWTVTAATGDIVKTANGAAGTSVTCNFWFLGTST